MVNFSSACWKQNWVDPLLYYFANGPRTLVPDNNPTDSLLNCMGEDRGVEAIIEAAGNPDL